MHIAAPDNVPNFVGFMLILAGALFAAGSYVIHVWRLHTFTLNEPLNRYTTLVFNGILIAMISLTLIFEMCYAILYPYHGTARAAAVAVGGEEPTA